ncbi:MAG TPA: glycosyltransferase [Gaiellaceae bacterium]|nr:glycosyltransferase [Gaiellaceae bacterium]
MNVALVHDYLTQRGGAERVVVSLLRAFPDAPLYTSLYAPELTFPEFSSARIATLPLDRVPLLRRDHRLALPLLASSFSRLHVEADVAICSSSGWSHGATVEGCKIVYCHTPARWLYQPGRYLGDAPPRGARALLAVERRRLLRWDRAAAASATRYVANSTAVRERVRDAYGIEAEVVPPPYAVDVDGARRAAPFDAGFTLCVSRLLPYKNVDAILAAFAELPRERLVVVGRGPDAARLRRLAPPNAVVLEAVDDDELRWLYASSRALVAASYEDFGLTPLEAAAFGRPAAVLRFGGYLDTVVEDETGVFFERPEPDEIRDALLRLYAREWDEATIRSRADEFSEPRFVERMRSLVAEVAA